MTHTPGPWQVSGVRASQPPRIGKDARILNVGPDGDYLAMVFFDMKTGRGQADARLIAASPDMLSALELTKKYLESLAPALNTMAREVLGDIITDQIDPAIAKARGGE